MNLIVTIICLVLFFVFGYRTLGEYGYTATPKLSLPFLEIKKQTVETKVNSGKNEKMSSFILYHSEPKPRTEILNQGKFDIYLHGTQFNGETKQIEHKKYTIPAGFSYFLDGNLLLEWIKINLQKDSENYIPFNVFLTDTDGKKYIMENTLYIKRKNDVIDIQPQTTSLEETEW